MDFRILGPIEVFAEGQPLPLGGARQRALLAYLLLHANQVVDAGRILDEVWTEPPRGGLGALQSQISRVRKLLGDRIVTSGSGYAIRIEPGELDLDRFRTLLADAGAARDPVRRSSLLRDAEELWHGPPLAGLDVPFVAAEAAALQELRLATVEDRLEAELELGRDGELVAELSGLVARNPLRERLRGQLILALYRSGRQADALDVYRETRRMLDSELGLEPSPALRELERAILRHDPALGRPAPLAAELPRAATRNPLRTKRLVAGAAVALGVGAVSAAALTHHGGGAGINRVASNPPAKAAPGPIARPAKHVPPARVRSRPRAHVTHKAVHGDAVGQPPAAETTNPSPPAARATAPVPSAPPDPGTTTVSSPPPPATKETVPAPSPPPSKAPPSMTATKPKASATPPPPPPSPPATPSQPRPGPPPSTSVTISDTFDGDIVEPTIWHQIKTDENVSIAQQGGQLLITVGTAAVRAGTYNQIDAHVGTQCSFPGNFDARVDYTLLEWPSADNIFVGLNAFFAGSAVGRESSSQWGDQYAGWVTPDNNGSLPLPDLSGSLRIARVDQIETAFVWHRDRWVKLATGYAKGAAVLGLQASSVDSTSQFGGQELEVAFDNFTVTAIDPICPLSSQPAG